MVEDFIDTAGAAPAGGPPRPVRVSRGLSGSEAPPPLSRPRAPRPRRHSLSAWRGVLARADSWSAAAL